MTAIPAARYSRSSIITESSKNAEIKFVIADNFHQERELDISFQSKTETDMEL